MSIASDMQLKALTSRVAELEREFSELKANLEYEEPTPDGAESIKRKGGWKWKKNTKSANVN